MRLLALSALAIAACNPPAAVAPPPDVSVAEAGSDPCSVACTVLASTCAQPAHADCAKVCRTVTADPNFASTFNVACIVKARTAAEVAVCGQACTAR